MEVRNKTVICLIIASLLITSAVSVFADNEINRPIEEEISDSLASEIEKQRLEEDARKNAHAAFDVPPTEESIRESSEEKMRLVAQAQKNARATFDVLPTEESIKKLVSMIRDGSRTVPYHSHSMVAQGLGLRS